MESLILRGLLGGILISFDFGSGEQQVPGAQKYGKYLPSNEH